MNKWFMNNFFKMNPEKCHLLISNYPKCVSLIVKDEITESSDTVKLLGITFDNKLDFTEHITKLCKKANQKLHAMARISKLITKEKLRIILKSFIESQFAYCPLVWMFCSRKLNNRINRIHERALRIIYTEDPSLTFEELLRIDKSFSVNHRNL